MDAGKAVLPVHVHFIVLNNAALSHGIFRKMLIRKIAGKLTDITAGRLAAVKRWKLNLQKNLDTIRQQGERRRGRVVIADRSQRHPIYNQARFFLDANVSV